MQIDMTRENWRKMFQIAFLYGVSRRTQMIERRLHVPSIPNGNHVEQEAETGCPIKLAGQIAIGQYPKLPIGDQTRQAMHGFSLVEHASYPASIRFVGKERQDIDGLEHASIFLQATMDEIFVVERL